MAVKAALSVMSMKLVASSSLVRTASGLKTQNIDTLKGCNQAPFGVFLLAS